MGKNKPFVKTVEAVEPQPVVVDTQLPASEEIVTSENPVTIFVPIPLVEAVAVREPVKESEPLREPEVVQVEVLVGALSIEWPIDSQPVTSSKRFVRGMRLEMPYQRAKRLEHEGSIRIL